NRLIVAGSGNATLSGSMSGAGGVTMSGNGILTLSGSNGFSGGVILGSGTLALGSATALGATAGTLTVNGGALDSSLAGLTLVNNNPQSWNSDINFVGTNNLNLGTGAVTPNANRVVTVGASTLTVGGVIGGGAISLTKAGPGTLVLSGANT